MVKREAVEATQQVCLLDEVVDRFCTSRYLSKSDAAAHEEGLKDDIFLQCGRCAATCALSQEKGSVRLISRVVYPASPSLLVCPEQPVTPLVHIQVAPDAPRQLSY